MNKTANQTKLAGFCIQMMVDRVFTTWKIHHIEDSPHGRFTTHSARHFNEKLPAL